jgi:cytochrome oxidase Cu insertion factor (SCO1/SenC/PrrC family)
MANFDKKNKLSNFSVDEYMNSISIKSEKMIPVVKKTIKISDDNIIIPTIKNYNDITNYNYNVSQLKIIAKNYKLKISGNKNELVSRIFTFLYLSSYIIKIQKVFRGHIVKKYIGLHGPAATKRNLCTNSTDFVSMEPLEEIKFNQFLSYKDEDGFIYGFDITSLFNLFSKNGNINNNPYNRNKIPDTILKNIKTLLRLSKILKITIVLDLEDETPSISEEKVVELRALSLFQNIDSLGNYSNCNWFLSLNRNQIIKFVRELADIWSYRAQLSVETKRAICPPNADPFRNLNMSLVHVSQNFNIVRKVVLEVLEKLVNTGVDKDSKSLGAYYVLGALTLVNQDAATSLPWLFQSLNYF